MRLTATFAVVLVFLALLAFPSLAFDLEGHRGTRGLAPENTLAAFRRAIEIGVTTIETDITPTSSADTPDPATFARLVVAAVRAADVASRVTVQSFDWRTLVEVKRIAPDIETSCLTIQTQNDDTVTSPDGGPSPWHAG